MYHLRIKSAREALSLTLQDLSDATGIPVSALSKIERGEHNPTLSTLSRIARAMPTEAERIIIWHS
jgi:transcriptional regulator with XRE-family HTH domain